MQKVQWIVYDIRGEKIIFEIKSSSIKIPDGFFL